MTGIFAFTLKPAPKLTRLKLVIRRQKFCEGLSFIGTSGERTDLRTADTVKIHVEGDDLEVEIAGSSLEAMRSGGTVEYVNQYR